jgi:galactokinase
VTARALDPGSWEVLLARAAEAWGGSAEGARLFFAPGRVNLFGAHLDYSGGPVLPGAIDRGTLVVGRPRDDGRLTLGTTLDARRFDGRLGALPEAPAGAWFDYPVGALAALVGGRAHAQGQGLDLFFGGDLPVGAGLSSSASISVVTALAADALLGLGAGRESWVAAALAGERGFVGVQCGIMDPHAVGHARPGHLLWLDCKDGSWEHVPLDPERAAYLVFDTGVQRELAKGEFNLRVAQCAQAFQVLAPHQPGASCLRDILPETLEREGHRLDLTVRSRALHAVQEVERTFAARRHLEAGDLAAAGRLMFEAHASLRDLYEVSVPELDHLVALLEGEVGCFGARLTGAGFGGCVVALVEPDRVAELGPRVAEGFQDRFGRRAPFEAFSGDAGPRELPLAR